MNKVNIGSDNGLSPIQRQAIVRTVVGLLLSGPIGKKSQSKYKTFHSPKWKYRSHESIVREIAAISPGIDKLSTNEVTRIDVSKPDQQYTTTIQGSTRHAPNLWYVCCVQCIWITFSIQTPVLKYMIMIHCIFLVKKYICHIWKYGWSSMWMKHFLLSLTNCSPFI